MWKTRSFLRGLGTGFIAGALLLQVMLLVRDTDSRLQQPASEPQPSPALQLTAELVKEKAESLNLQVYDKSVKLYSQKELDDAVEQAVKAAKAEAPAVTPAPEAKQVTVYITAGMTATQVADILHKSGIIADQGAFEQAIQQNQATSKIRSGTYAFQQNETIQNVIAKLTTPPPL